MQSIVAETEEHRSRLAARCLLLWHLCSLDAPTIAVAWSLLLLEQVEAPLRARQMLVLFLGTWVVYVLDRILDSHAGNPGCTPGLGPAPTSLLPGRTVIQAQGLPHLPANLRRLAERHYFHHRHRRLLLTLSGLAAVAVVTLCRALSSRLVLVYLLLGAPVLAYAYWVHGSAAWLPRLVSGAPRPEQAREPAPEQAQQQAREPVKEPAVAILFTAAVAAPAAVSSPRGSHLALLFACVLLGLLCWLNCAVITFAEAPTVAERERAKLGLFAAALAALAAAGCSRSLASTAGQRGHLFPATASVTFSSLLLLGLLFAPGGTRQLPRRVRVLADAALLTPLVFLLPGTR